MTNAAPCHQQYYRVIVVPPPPPLMEWNARQQCDVHAYDHARVQQEQRCAESEMENDGRRILQRRHRTTIVVPAASPMWGRTNPPPQGWIVTHHGVGGGGGWGRNLLYLALLSLSSAHPYQRLTFSKIITSLS